MRYSERKNKGVQGQISAFVQMHAFHANIDTKKIRCSTIRILTLVSKFVGFVKRLYKVTTVVHTREERGVQ